MNYLQKSNTDSTTTDHINHAPNTNTIEKCLADVEALQEEIKYSKSDYETLLKAEISLYQGGLERDGTGIVGASERFLLPLNQLCLKLAMLSHRNYKLGYSSSLKPVHVGMGTYSLELKKSDKRQEEDIKALTVQVKERYNASIAEGEAKRQADLIDAKKALQTVVAADREYKARIDKALENL